MLICPCGSNQTFTHCCDQYINQKINPTTPEQLMRSRYTAYTQANIDYIQKTMKAPASNHFDPESARQWATHVKWLGLDVLHSQTKKMKGTVEFIASFEENGKKSCIHEISEFHLIEGQWYYVEGKQKPPRSTAKLGRNDLCSCGSGKKFKSCCLNIL